MKKVFDSKKNMVFEVENRKERLKKHTSILLLTGYDNQGKKVEQLMSKSFFDSLVKKTDLVFIK